MAFDQNLPVSEENDPWESYTDSDKLRHALYTNQMLTMQRNESRDRVVKLRATNDMFRGKNVALARSLITVVHAVEADYGTEHWNMNKAFWLQAARDALGWPPFRAKKEEAS